VVRGGQVAQLVLRQVQHPQSAKQL
jgi:hypothetical protein